MSKLRQPKLCMKTHLVGDDCKPLLIKAGEDVTVPLGWNFVFSISSQSSQVFAHERNWHKEDKSQKLSNFQNFNSWTIKLTNCKVPKDYLKLLSFWHYFLCQFLSWEKNLRGLRENLKHKIRPLVTLEQQKKEEEEKLKWVHFKIYLLKNMYIELFICCIW